MDFRFTKYGFTNALWTLIPIFPIFSIFPCILMAMGIEKVIHNCEMSYAIVLWFSILLILLIAVLYILKIEKTLTRENKVVRERFMLLNFLLYILANTAIFIIMIGTNIACHGDGQTALMVIMSGPAASLFLIVFGFTIDVIRK